MNREDPEVDRFFRLSERYELGGDLLLLLEGPDGHLDEAVNDLVPVLEALDSVSMVTNAIPQAWLTEQAPWLIERKLFDRWLSLVRDPTQLLGDPDALSRSAAELGGEDAGVFEGRLSPVSQAGPEPARRDTRRSSLLRRRAGPPWPRCVGTRKCPFPSPACRSLQPKTRAGPWHRCAASARSPSSSWPYSSRGSSDGGTGSQR